MSGKHLFGYLMVLSVVCLLLPRGCTDRCDHAFLRLVGPLSAEGADFSLDVTQPWRTRGHQSPSPQQYEQFRRQVRQLSTELENLRSLYDQACRANERWAGVRDQFGQARVDFVRAQVVGVDSSSWPQVVTLDRGETHGLRYGQIILALVGDNPDAPNADPALAACSTAIVGKVESVGPHTARMQLLTSAQFSLAAFVEPRWSRHQQWRGSGHLYGQQNGPALLKLVKVEDAPVEVGDPIKARYNPQVLPIEMLIGFVQDCQRDGQNPLLWHIAVAPAADLYALQEVLVVVPRHQNESL